MQTPKRADSTIVRKLPPEWHEFRKLCMDEGVSAVEKIRRFIIETVKKSHGK